VNALLFDFNLVPRCLVSEVLGRGLGLNGWVIGLGFEACALDSNTANDAPKSCTNIGQSSWGTNVQFNEWYL